MCGIFGFSYIDKKDSNDFSKIESDIELFTKLNKIRGSDTFGVSFCSKGENFVYKVNTEPSKAINRRDSSGKSIPTTFEDMHPFLLKKELLESTFKYYKQNIERKK